VPCLSCNNNPRAVHMPLNHSCVCMRLKRL
jgi:hypothetical protein